MCIVCAEEMILVLLFAVLTVAMSASGSLSRFSLRQAINLPALKKLGSLLRNPSLVVPQISIKSLSELDFVKLKARGVKYLVFDKDNTLTRAFEDDLHDSVKEAVDKAHTEFPGKIAILSNSVGSSDDKGYKAAAETEKSLRIPVIRHRVKKPACLAEVKEHFSSKEKVVNEYKIVDLNDPLTVRATPTRSVGEASEEETGNRVVLPSEICMIGDRVLTDVVFANINGMVSVLVAPLCVRTDHPIAVAIRFLEVKILLPLLRLVGIQARALSKN